MSFAPHANNARTIGTDPVVAGQFREADTGNTFEFALRDTAPDNVAMAADWACPIQYPHVVYVNGGFRYARVLKSRVYVVTDEDASGNPVDEKWFIRGHRAYDVADYV